MPAEYRILGPLEARLDDRPIALGPPRHKALLVLLLIRANTFIAAERLIDELWGDDAPASAQNLVQGGVSSLRKALGRDAIETRGTAYALRVRALGLDLHRFERLAEEGALALAATRHEDASRALGDALALWRGPALADLAEEAAVRPVAARLDDLHLVVQERFVQAELGRDRHAEVVTELRRLVLEHPLREQAHALLMLALYRCGRQADALEAYRTARATLVRELGIEPGPRLRQLEAQVLRHDPALLPSARPPGAPPGPAAADALRSLLIAPFAPGALDRLVAVAEPLARMPPRELIAVATVTDGDALTALAAELAVHRAALAVRGVTARVAAFTSLTPGADVARLAQEQDVDLVLVDAPTGMLEDGRVLALLEHAPCDVAVLAGAAASSWADEGPVFVPFGGASHDWAAVEIGAWLARARSVPLRLAGATAGDASGRDASRLLASASLAVQRALGVAAEPLLVAPDADTLLAAAGEASIVVVGLTERWRRHGLGPARTALATRARVPALLVRGGRRPSGLAPAGSETRFTWTLAAP
jgi:DNA-binding SARP family transcriptional activator